MDLKTFVREALLQIDSALEETSKEFTKYSYKYWKNAWWNPTIDFEVQVYASEWAWSEWEAWINVAFLKAWSHWERHNESHELSKISFSVVRENTSQQDAIEREERMKNLPDPTWDPIDNNPYE